MSKLYPRVARVLGPLSVVVGACAVLVDLVTPISLNVSIVFSIPLVLAGLTRSRVLLWSLFLALLCVTFAIYDLELGGPLHHAPVESLLQNRVLAAVTMLITTVLLHVWIRALDAVERRDRRLEETNARLLHYQRQIHEQNETLERRRREAEAASERKSVLLASVSHDVRTPLAAINLAAQAISRGAAEPTLAVPITVLAQQIRANSVAVEQLVADILDFSTFELGHTALHPSDIELAELISQLCRSLLPLAEAKKLALLVQPPAESIVIHADRIKFGRVLNNLVVNAIKYTQSGCVWVTAGRGDDGGVWVCIRDSGVGIAAEDAARIFDEFLQLQQPPNGRRQGWGLGLAICKRLVTLMGGTIKVDSSPNIGSTFTVALPSACVVPGAWHIPADDAPADSASHDHDTPSSRVDGDGTTGASPR